MAIGLAALLTATPGVAWAPQPGSQTLFVTSPVFETLYEGTRGPGKTNALLKVLEPYGIKEMAQSGLLAIGRGSKSITERVFKN